MKTSLFTLLFVAISLFISEVNAQVFSEQTEINLVGVDEGSFAWGDYNNDGLLDLQMSGLISAPSNKASIIYKNDGNNSFTAQTGQMAITAIHGGSSDWADYNNDGFIDFLLSGYSYFLDRYTKIFKNIDGVQLQAQTEINFTNVGSGCAVWGDLNNDGLIDVIVSGDSGSPNTRIYYNIGNNTYNELIGHNIVPLKSSNIALGDYDNDGDLDILLSGETTNYNYISKLYKNAGNKTFIEQTGTTLINNIIGNVAWGDFNNDGFLDILLTGCYYSSPNYVLISKVYKNNADNTFTELSDLPIPGIYGGASIWGDFNNDGYVDILVSGSTVYSPYNENTKVFLNNGDETFTEELNAQLIGLICTAAACGDYDDDGDLDIALSGRSGSSVLSKIYKNESDILNSLPNTITNLNAEVNGPNVTFTWDEATDDNQVGGHSYNLYLYNTTDEKHLTPVYSFKQTHPLNGKRLVAKFGNIQGVRDNGRVSYTLYGILDSFKEYVWSVQAIDASMAGGSFAAEAEFFTSEVTSIESTSNVVKLFPNPTFGMITIDFGSVKVNRLSVNDLLGKQLLTLDVFEPIIELNISNLSKGVYFIVAESNYEIITSKIVKE